jgi:NADH-quinone oxidoreductase subunit N
MFTYGLSVVGIFAIIGQLERKHGELALTDLAGLSRRSPLLALSLFVFVLSLAGIPPLSGFFGKFYVFLAAIQADTGLLWIVGTAIAASAVSLYYYLQILKQVFVAEADAGPSPLLPFAPAATTVVLAAAVVFLGCFPQVLLEPLEASVRKPELPRQEFTSIAPDVSAAIK